MGLRVQLLPPHESGLSSKFFNTTPYVLCRICNESGLAFHVAAVKYGQERENNTQANPFYSPMLECSDKGGLLPLPLLYDYQYVLGHLTIERCPNRLWQAWNKLRFCSVGGSIRKRCTSPLALAQHCQTSHRSWMCICVSPDRHALLNPALYQLFFFCLLPICATPNSLIQHSSRTGAGVAAKLQECWQKQRPLLTISVQAPSQMLFLVSHIM